MSDPGPGESASLESVPLPAGVTAGQWSEEKARWQNPRIRTLLGCANIVESIYESNQAILSCSPERLAELWRAVREVSRLLSNEVLPLLAGPSHIPKLEEARQRTRAAAQVILSTVIAKIERMPTQVAEGQSRELRRLLCVSLGQLHDFLQDAFADLMASDPRSFHDSGYFLSRRFRRDVEEAEWLLSTVAALSRQLEQLEERRRILGALLARPRAPAAPPANAAEKAEEAAEQKAVAALLDELVAELTPRLKEVIALRGIRFAELEVVDRWAADLPVRCRVVLELWQLAEAGDQAGLAAGEGWTHLIRERVWTILGELDGMLKDLRAFLPLWRRGIASRRALSFRRPDAVEPAG